MRFDGVIHNFAAGIFVWFRPDSESKLSSRAQNAKCFRACSFWLREMEQAKIHQDPIVACITDWQFLCIAFAKRDSGKHFRGDLNHFLREIDTRWVRSQLLDGGRDISGSARNIQHRHSGQNASSINQIRNELPRHPRPDGVVLICYALPAIVFEAGKFAWNCFHADAGAIALFGKVSCTLRIAKRLQLLQWKFDWLFFLARDKSVSLDDSNTRIPTKQCVVVAGRMNCFVGIRVFESSSETDLSRA